MFINLYLSFCSVFADDFCCYTHADSYDFDSVGAKVIGRTRTAAIPSSRKLRVWSA